MRKISIAKENVCDEKVFNEIFRKYARELHDFLYYRFGNNNQPGDLVQEAFLKLWNNCHKVRPDKARSFLFTIANNQMLNEISRKKTALNYRLQESQKHRTLESPEYVLREKEYMDSLKRGLESLTEEQRTAFMLNRIDGKRHKEIAEMLGISRKTVEKRIYTALKKLQKHLGKI